MATKKQHLRHVGLLVSVALAIFITAIIIIGRETNIFKPNLKITTTFEDVKGLKIGNNVRFTGVQIGSVVNMVIIEGARVQVELSINKEIAPFIRKNSVATIGNEGLMGNKILILLPGTSESPSVEEGDILLSIEPVEIDDIIKEIKHSSEKISEVTNNLIGITDKINRGDGIFGKIFTDTTFTRNLDRTSQNATAITRNLIEISEKANSGYGILGKLLTDTVFSSQLDSASYSLRQISGNLVDITDKINKGEGIFGSLFTDTTLTSNLFITSKNLEASTYNLYKLTQKMNSEGNVIYKFVSDTTFSDSLEIFMKRLNEAVIEATKASEAIKSSGLIRLFSKDPDKNKEN